MEIGCVASARDHPFVSNFHPVLSTALRCNVDVQTITVGLRATLKNLKERILVEDHMTYYKAVQVAQSSFRSMLSDSIVISHYITGYITKSAPSAAPLFDMRFVASSFYKNVANHKEYCPTQQALLDINWCMLIHARSWTVLFKKCRTTGLQRGWVRPRSEGRRPIRDQQRLETVNRKQMMKGGFFGVFLGEFLDVTKKNCPPFFALFFRLRV